MQLSTKYSNGLHQILQIKHGLNITTFNLITNYLSNVTFFKRYKTETSNNICGMTGTLGSVHCCQMLAKVYDVDLCKLPRSRPRYLNIFKDQIKPNESEWLDAIERTVKQLAQDRAVLVLADSIEAVGRIRRRLRNSVINLIVYERDDIQELPNSKLHLGDVIVSTNLAGRGVHIQLDKEVVNNGGLHVILTFLSVNSRVQEQAFGRAGRQGEPGSAQIIINYEAEMARLEGVESPGGRPLIMEDFELIRNVREKISLEWSIERIGEIEKKDKLFMQFVKLVREVLDNKTKKFNEFEKEMIGIYLTLI